ncbi:DUF2924 domain-containing protein [Sphingomonas ginsengisoli (ex An et al. 2013)]|uniref:DUF2924 domain-containing protein n=1 Tax=Sphingomonas ginsengisoli (ex An et al. 2013) TaxID=363835 RepID=UPI00144585B4|nr:DUF2924 domain-containing protein [Sphingomonas ginsengisoli An et al. 2013]
MEEQVAALEQMDLHQLRAEWDLRFGAPPTARSAKMVRLALAWRIQAQALGGLSREMRDALARTGRVVAEGQDLGAGATLRRTWDGVEHVVTVQEGSFDWNGRRFRSLSGVATAIAGTRWNGRRFFGLRS